MHLVDIDLDAKFTPLSGDRQHPARRVHSMEHRFDPLVLPASFEPASDPVTPPNVPAVEQVHSPPALGCSGLIGFGFQRVSVANDPPLRMKKAFTATWVTVKAEYLWAGIQFDRTNFPAAIQWMATALAFAAVPDFSSPGIFAESGHRGFLNRAFAQVLDDLRDVVVAHTKMLRNIAYQTVFIEHSIYAIRDQLEIGRLAAFSRQPLPPPASILIRNSAFIGGMFHKLGDFAFPAPELLGDLQTQYILLI